MRSTNRHRLILAAVFVFATWAGAAAFADDTAAKSAADETAAGAGGAAEADTVVIEVKDYKFVPGEITVRVGTTVRWENHERRQYHNVFFEELGDDPSDYFFPDEYRERTFDKPGTYTYICEPHIGDHHMKGVVHVVE